MPPGWRAPGAIRGSGEDWTWPHARRRVAARSATEKPARVPRELRCERSQQSRETPLLCPVSPPPPSTSRPSLGAGLGVSRVPGKRGVARSDFPGLSRLPAFVSTRGALCLRGAPARKWKEWDSQDQPPRHTGELLWANSPFAWYCICSDLLAATELECILPPRAPMGGCDPGRAGMSH